jgi:5-methylcytosine-specific restriction protein A
MPHKRPCATPRCPNLVEGAQSRCPQHQKQHNKRDQQWRGSAQERGYTFRWAQASKRHLAHEPFCRRCKARGIVTIATLTDHIIPVDGPNDPLFWKESNWQSLDVACHAEKTQEDKAKGLTEDDYNIIINL